MHDPNMRWKRIHKFTKRSVTVIAVTIASAFWARTMGEARADGFTIKNENATFSLSNIPSMPTNLPASAEFTVGGQGNPNQAFQNWWWFRLPNDTRESAINAMNPTWTVNGNNATATFALTPTIDATMTYTIFGGANNTALLQEDLTIKNNGQNNIPIYLFNYLDLDLGGTKDDDKANAVANNEILVSDANWVADYKALRTGLVGYDSDAFPTVRNLLTNNAKDDFPNAQQFFGPGDWTGGFEWMRTVNANGGTAGVSVTVQLGPQPMPEPSTLALLLVGLFAFSLKIRFGQPLYGLPH